MPHCAHQTERTACSLQGHWYRKAEPQQTIGFESHLQLLQIPPWAGVPYLWLAVAVITPQLSPPRFPRCLAQKETAFRLRRKAVPMFTIEGYYDTGRHKSRR
jgi:hypothetical protein